MWELDGEESHDSQTHDGDEETDDAGDPPDAEDDGGVYEVGDEGDGDADPDPEGDDAEGHHCAELDGAGFGFSCMVGDGHDLEGDDGQYAGGEVEDESTNSGGEGDDGESCGGVDGWEDEEAEELALLVEWCGD